MERKESELINKILETSVKENSNSQKYSDQIAFNLFFDRILIYFKVKLKEALENVISNSIIDWDVKNIVESNCMTIRDELFSICIRTLIYDINEKRILGLLEGQTSQERYENYNLYFSDNEKFTDFFEKFPVLISLIEVMISNRVELIQEIASRICIDKSELEEKFRFDFNSIENIKITSGDTHNGGKKVSFIITDNKKIIYKPHSLSTDKMFNNIIDYINSNTSLKFDINYLQCINKNEYGWQQYVPFKICNEEEEVNKYFYRIGALLSVIYSIGVTDIHFENLICSGQYPCIIDLETLIENKSFIENNTEDLVTMFNKNINESVLGTALLPLNFKNSIFDFDMSAMSTAEEQISDFWQMHVIVNNMSDEIRLEKKPGKFSKGENQVMIKNKKVEPYLYIEDILEGFEDAYRGILNNKNDYWCCIFNYFNENEIIVRQVLKPTSIYAKFLEASTHPNYLKNSEDRIRLLNKLKTSKDIINDKVVIQRNQEIKALICMDIPYFTTKMNSKEIEANKEEIIENFFSKTLVDILEERVGKLCLADLDKQMMYIRLSLSTSVNNNWFKETNGIFPKLNSKIGYFKKSHDFIENAKEIGEFLIDNAIWDKERTTCTWLTQLIQGEKLKLGVHNYMLYEGGGIIIFLYQLAKETQEERYLELANGSLKAIEVALKNEKPIANLSAFNGIGSLIYIYYSAYRINNDLSYYVRYNKYVELLYKYEFDGDLDIDYVGGIAGLIVLLINIYNIEKTEQILDICKKLGEVLFERGSNTDIINLAGMSHGYSGVALAFAKLGDVLNNTKYINKARDLINIENQYYDSAINNWRDLRDDEGNSDPVFWCHGSPGILLTRSLLSKYTFMDINIINNDIENALNKLLVEGFRDDKDHSLCHGIFGNIDILISVAKLLKNNQLLEIANNEAKVAIEGIRKSRVKCGLNNAVDLISFMVGLTGMGYVFLRLNNPLIPSVLSLDI
ncbi:type 2 lanthipeptide synthetase LanM family protein [Clostridium gasigenes]|uniref:type 2 lanthipeptide synthetase LanM family protein n=1 Tax=Clostridium gasigenes TaxID=94869 RepID=UPI001C0D9402|nr:type 2 lanthipeptide synthetase LanM family protein [Clostridium gasigenes]MBU3107031.1 type 2 lantipeptide synthetase LanM family protein [Clostridium gasigenes]